MIFSKDMNLVEGTKEDLNQLSTKQPTLPPLLTLPLGMLLSLQAWGKLKPSGTKHFFGTLDSTMCFGWPVVSCSWSRGQSQVSVKSKQEMLCPWANDSTEGTVLWMDWMLAQAILRVFDTGPGFVLMSTANAALLAENGTLQASAYCVEWNG